MTSQISGGKWAAIAATSLAGLMTGALAFVSAVDVRSFLKHVESEEGKALARQHFQVWWPYGRDFMVPLVGAAATANAVAWRMTKDKAWAVSGLLVFLVGPYTAIILMEDINKLSNSSGEELKEVTVRFCMLHHVRTVLAASGFGVALFSLAELRD